MFAQFVNVLYSIVDRIYVGNIPVTGVDALAGRGRLRAHRHSAVVLRHAVWHRWFRTLLRPARGGRREGGEAYPGQQLYDDAHRICGADRDFSSHERISAELVRSQ